MNIKHLSIYKIAKELVFNGVNSYKEMNDAIKAYGNLDQYDYNNRVGEAFEIFTEFFCSKYGDTPLLGIKNVLDTSSDSFNAGYDFTFIDLSDKPGQIQSKWKSDPTHEFTLAELATNSAIASDMDIEKNNNVLFINFDDSDKLFHYSYKTARNKRRVIGRNAQEEFILRDPKFWDDFRKCIKESSIEEFEEPYTPRDIQNWVLDGVEKDGVIYEGTESVINGKYSKGRVEVSTGGGKTLCQFYNIKKSFESYNKNVSVMILPTRSLISQTFGNFYKFKMFGYTDRENITHDTKVSCVIIMSGDKPKFNDTIVDVIQTLNIKDIVNFVKTRINNGRKVVIFTTMRSQDLKYSEIVDELKKENIRIGLEQVDEYHNIINASAERKDQLETYDYLEKNIDRCDGTIFYSASNKNGQILSSFDVNLFGNLLCKVNRQELKERGYVCPKLVFKIIRVKTLKNKNETKRQARRNGLDLDKAQSEAVGSILAFNDMKKYYEQPNLITFGDHVEGCRFISKSDEMKKHLPNVKNHFIAAETPNTERDNIMETIRYSGNNILHQHSVAKEGIDIKNLNGGLFGRSMGIISIQQGVGRSDRALEEDTENFKKGLITLDSTLGWKKYTNLMYVIVDDNDDTFADRIKQIVKYLLESGIPQDEWDITEIDDEGKNKVEIDNPDFAVAIVGKVKFDSDKIKKMIEKSKIEIMNEEIQIADEIEKMREDEKFDALDELEQIDFLLND